MLNSGQKSRALETYGLGSSDGTKKLSFGGSIKDGDLVIVYEKRDVMKAVKVTPTPELWTLVLSHRTQILYIADISFLITYLEIVPGSLVLESGTGSGSLTTSLARAVAPTGHVYTFDFHQQRATSAREDFQSTGVDSLVTVGVRDIQGEGFPDEYSGLADSVFLDLPQPWLAVPSAGKMLKQDCNVSHEESPRGQLIHLTG
ncbi:hypothetical protein OIU76_027030 [Salix suchowensis]|nr:hypothetical protein OIU76_027030 [Salix suchowensis]